MIPLYVKCHSCGHKEIYSSIVKDLFGCSACASIEVEKKPEYEVTPEWWEAASEEPSAPEQQPSGEGDA